MAGQEPLTKTLNIRMNESELAQIERFRQELQEQNPTFRVTQRTVILTALERLEAHLTKLEKDRAAKRVAAAKKETKAL